MLKKHILVLICAAAIISVSLPAIAGFEEGNVAYKRGDFATAFKEFARSADQGNVDAQFTLGVMYASGDGVDKDYKLAYMWFDLAAAKGKHKAVQYRNTCASQLTLAEIAEARSLAEEWKSKAK